MLLYPVCLLKNLQIYRGLSGVSWNLCGFARRAYYRYRSSGGLPVYSSVGVASSSIANSNQQVVDF